MHIVYIGDLDPAGLSIAESVAAEIKLHLKGLPVEFEHVSLTQEQVVAHGLQAMGHPRKPGEKRKPWIETCYEAEAMPAEALRDVTRQAIERHISTEELAAVRAVEDAERAEVLRFASRMEGRTMAEVNEWLDSNGSWDDDDDE